MTIFSESYILKNSHCLDLQAICSEQQLSEPLIEQLGDLLDWSLIWQYQQLSDGFMRAHIDRLMNSNMYLICQYQTLTEDFMNDYMHIFDRTALGKIIEHQQLSETFIQENAAVLSSYIRWRVSINKVLSCEFIHKYMSIFDETSRILICKNWRLSESFIRDHADQLNWYVLSLYQQLPVSITNEFRDRLIDCDNAKQCIERADLINDLATCISIDAALIVGEYMWA